MLAVAFDTPEFHAPSSTNASETVGGPGGVKKKLRLPQPNRPNQNLSRLRSRSQCRRLKLSPSAPANWQSFESKIYQKTQVLAYQWPVPLSTQAIGQKR